MIVLRRRLFATLLTLAGMAAFCGCSSSSRPIPTESQLREKALRDTASLDQSFHHAVGQLLARAEKRFDSSVDPTPPTLNILLLSGGGDFGAFGAGFLVGWGATTDPQGRRPDFDAVTGVSTGAILAPFAYVGADESCAEIEAFYRNPRKDWFQDRGLFSFFPSQPSFATISALERDLRKAIDRSFVEKMAEQSRKGKVLIISASDLDLRRQRFWDVGAEAEAAVAGGDVGRIQRIMLASAAIPAIIPPVEIDGSLYADGVVTANAFLRLDPRAPDGLIARWRADHAGKPLPRLRYWVIVNNQLSQPPKTVQMNWPSVLMSSFSIVIRSATVSQVQWLTAQADYVNSSLDADVEVRVVAIPDDWRAPVEGDFSKQTMESLSNLGRKLGADPDSWQVWTSPRLNLPDGVGPKSNRIRSANP